MFFSSLLVLQGYSQEISIRGTITDKETGETLPGASVLLDSKPPKFLGSTKTNGQFAVRATANSTLIFRLLGYADQRVSLKPGQTDVDIKLKPSSSMIKEVVIRGYQAKSKEISTGSSVTVTGKEIQDIPVSNAEQLLQGKVAGLNVQVNTGAPGFRGSVSIRGVSTLSVSGSGDNSFLTPTSPLYVIDGVPIDADNSTDYGFNSVDGVSPLSTIPPEDIQSIEVLKDAQSTALYGSRGAYGVIIVTTKRGTSKVPRVSLVSQIERYIWRASRKKG